MHSLCLATCITSKPCLGDTILYLIVLKCKVGLQLMPHNAACGFKVRALRNMPATTLGGEHCLLKRCCF